MEGKTAADVMEEGRKKLQSVPAGGAVVAAPAGGAAPAAAAGAPAAAAKKPEPESESDGGDMGFSLFD